MNNDELTIKKERVLAAAEKCPTAKAALMEIFPEAFKKKEEWTDITDRYPGIIKNSYGSGFWLSGPHAILVEVSNWGPDCDWKLENGRIMGRVKC